MRSNWNPDNHPVNPLPLEYDAIVNKLLLIEEFNAENLEFVLVTLQQAYDLDLQLIAARREMKEKLKIAGDGKGLLQELKSLNSTSRKNR